MPNSKIVRNYWKLNSLAWEKAKETQQLCEATCETLKGGNECNFLKVWSNYQIWKIYPREEFLVLENPLREKFMIPCQYIYPCFWMVCLF